MRAYSELYLNDAMHVLGEAFDYAKHCGYSPDHFMNSLIVSGIGKQIENGNPSYISGKSGKELAMDVYDAIGLELDDVERDICYSRSKEYWCGYELGYYHWRSNLTFDDIVKIISMHELIDLYPTLHEASDDKVVDVLNEKYKSQRKATNLQTLRKRAGLSQKQLAELSGVSIRMIQQYEIMDKDINKASAISLLRLSKVIGCSIEDLLEPNPFEE